MRGLLLLACLLLPPLPVGAEAIHVGPAEPVRSIKAALKLAKDGDQILVHAGIYKEHDLTVSRSITLKGMGNPVIDGELKGNILSIQANGVRVEGFTLMNVGRSFTNDFAGIEITRSRDFTIQHNLLKNVFFGIVVKKSKSGTIAFNEVSGEAVDEASSGNGIHAWHSSSLTIHDNQLHQVRDGIYLEFVDRSQIFNNNSYANLRYGLHFMFSNQDDYHHNLFTNNGAGVAVMFSKKIKMEHNAFAKNWGASAYGLLLKEIYDAEIRNNTFEQNTIGINAEGATRIEYHGNRFLRNGWAVKITGACYGNVFEGNDFANNTFDLSYNSQLNDNSFDGNYWTEYTGYDLDRDGIGDIPYRPVKLFCYVVNRSPEAIVLLRSLFIDLINFSEKVSPAFTPDGLLDHHPVMKARAE